MVPAQIPMGMTFRLKIHSKGMYCLKGIVELPGQDQRLSWGMSSCPFSSKEILTSIHPSSRAGSAVAVQEPNSNPLPRQPPLPINNFEKYSHILLFMFDLSLHATAEHLSGCSRALKILTPALKHDWIYQKGFTIFAALSSEVLLLQNGFPCKCIFIQSAESALLTEKFQVRVHVIQKTVEAFGLVFVEFGEVDWKSFQFRNPRGYKHINKKSKANRHRGKWPKWGKGVAVGSQAEMVPGEHNWECGKPDREIEVYCETLLVTLLCCWGEWDDKSDALGRLLYSKRGRVTRRESRFRYLEENYHRNMDMRSPEPNRGMEAESRESKEINKKLDGFGQGINVRGKSSVTLIIVVCQPPEGQPSASSCAWRVVDRLWLLDERCDWQKWMGVADTQMVDGKGRNEKPARKPCWAWGKAVCIFFLCQKGKLDLSSHNKLGKQMAKDYPLLQFFLNVDKFRIRLHPGLYTHTVTLFCSLSNIQAHTCFGRVFSKWTVHKRAVFNCAELHRRYRITEKPRLRMASVRCDLLICFSKVPYMIVGSQLWLQAEIDGHLCLSPICCYLGFESDAYGKGEIYLCWKKLGSLKPI